MRFFSDVLTYCAMLQAFICYCSSSDVYDVRACARARVCVIHWHCSAQLSMFNMEKRYRNKIIIIIIIIIIKGYLEMSNLAKIVCTSVTKI